MGIDFFPMRGKKSQSPFPGQVLLQGYLGLLHKLFVDAEDLLDGGVIVSLNIEISLAIKGGLPHEVLVDVDQSLIGDLSQANAVHRVPPEGGIPVSQELLWRNRPVLKAIPPFDPISVEGEQVIPLRFRVESQFHPGEFSPVNPWFLRVDLHRLMKKIPGIDQILYAVQNHNQATMDVPPCSHIGHHRIAGEAVMDEDRLQEKGQGKTGTTQPEGDVILH